MKKILLLVLLSPLFVLAQVKGFSIDGKLEGFPDGSLVRLFKNGESTEFVSGKLQGGRFLLKGNVKEPVLCYLIIGDNNNKPVEIYVENAAISFKGKNVEPAVYEISGSQSHKDFTSFTTAFVPVARQLSTLAGSINATAPGPDRDKLMGTYTDMQQSLQKQIDNFIKEKPRSPVSAFVLNATYQFNEDVVMLENRFTLLDPSVKKSETGLQLQAFIAEKKVGAVGTQALDFTQPDTTGHPISLSSFRGKYVLVDFWASWCGPCRNENPNVVENFNKFSAKNFTILGVSLDRPGQKERWLEAIKSDNLTWNHVSDLQYWNNAVAQLYHIQGIPQNILVDPNGKIIAKNLRGPALQAKLCEIFGCN